MSQINTFSHDTGYNVSKRYSAVNTGIIVQQFEAQGFELHRQSHARVKDAAKAGFQRHLFAFRHPSMQLRGVGDSVPEILLKNSYDGSSSFKLMLGIYRLVCSNGLIVGTTYNAVSVRHVGANALERAVQGAFEVSQQIERAADNIQRMQAVQLSQMQQLQFAENAAGLIVPANAVQFRASDLLRARRGPDTGSDLWTVFNRVQENIVRGGLRYSTIDAQSRVRNQTKRAVRSIDTTIDVNRALWTIAEQYMGGAA